MNVLVTGGNGQLASEFRFLATSSNHEFTFVDVEDLDITNEEQVETFLSENEYDACINCAAYTAVDKAEEDTALAEKVNVEGVEVLAKACDKHDVIVFHVSTDFVFDGKSNVFYKESDETNPISVYGQTKLDGEQALINNAEKYYIIRTSWLYSSFGNNFVKTMLRLGEERESLGIIVDQVGTPTYARDLARAILTIMDSDKKEYGVYHYSNEGVASWYDFALSTLRKKHIEVEINPIPTTQFPTPAERPKFSVMDKSKIKTTFGVEIPHWQDSLELMLHLV